MEHKIINTGTYLLIVDDSEIKEGDFFMTDDNRIELYAPDWRAREWHKKIIAHLPLNNSPILEGVDLLPPLEDDVEKLAMLYARTIPAAMSEEEADYAANGFYNGYNKHAEKYKYTEEDMKKAMLKYGEWIMSNLSSKEYIKDSNNQTVYEHIIQSLQQPKIPVGFSTLEQWYNPKTNKAGYSLPEVTGLNDNDGCYMVHSVITNSQGLTQWVGEYIYD